MFMKLRMKIMPKEMNPFLAHNIKTGHSIDFLVFLYPFFLPIDLYVSREPFFSHSINVLLPVQLIILCVIYNIFGI